MKFIKISCIGDLLSADTTYSLDNGIGSNLPSLIEYYSMNHKKPFPNSDILFCNLESPLISNSDFRSLPFAGNPAVIGLLKVLGVSIVSVANNHMMDHGKDGFLHTVKSLEENGIFHIGTKKECESNIVLLEIKGKKFAFAAFNEIPDHPDDNLIARPEKDLIHHTLQEIKKLSPDFTLFSLHWGNEYLSYPSPSQVALAHELIEMGVNVIIGHHPHVIQPIEKYNGGIIMYSLGNFLFDMFWSEQVRNGMQVDLIFNDDKSINYQIKPFRIRKNFTQDYTSDTWVLSRLLKSGKILKNLQSGPLEIYQKIYRRECKKRRLQSRLQMKLYLLIHLFSLSRLSRQILFKNLKIKSGLIWKKH